MTQCHANIAFTKRFRYPDYGGDIDAHLTKYNDEENYVQFDSFFAAAKVPFKDANLWDNLFPLDYGVN